MAGQNISTDAYWRRLNVNPSAATAAQQVDAESFFRTLEAQRAEAAAGVTIERGAQLMAMREDAYNRATYGDAPLKSPAPGSTPWAPAPGRLTAEDVAAMEAEEAARRFKPGRVYDAFGVDTGAAPTQQSIAADPAGHGFRNIDELGRPTGPAAAPATVDTTIAIALPAVDAIDLPKPNPDHQQSDDLTKGSGFVSSIGTSRISSIEPLQTGSAVEVDRALTDELVQLITAQQNFLATANVAGVRNETTQTFIDVQKD